MPNINNGYRLNMTYEGSQVLVDAKQVGIDPAVSTPTDQVLDLSKKQNLVTELTTQDLSQVKAIKLGSRFLAAPDQATLQGMVEQLKSLCLSDNGTLRSDFQRIVLERKTHEAHGNQLTTTQVSLNVIGPEPNDGFEDTHDYIRTVHLLQPNDTLEELVKQYYGDKNLERNVRLLANFNELSNPNHIEAGQPLYIPEEDMLLLYQKRPAPPLATPPVQTPVATPPGNESTSVPPQPPSQPVDPVPPTQPPAPTQPPTTPIDPAAAKYDGPMTAEGLMEFIGQDGIDFLITAEGAKTRAYKDSVGKWTIGVGHLIRLPAERNLLSKTLTQNDMRQLLLKDLSHHIQPLLDHLKPEVVKNLNRNQVTALASLAFNIGPGGTVKGRKRGFKYSPVVAALNRSGDFDRNIQTAAAALDRHAYAGGRRVTALANRRESERLLMLVPELKAGEMPVYEVRALRQLAQKHDIGA